MTEDFDDVMSIETIETGDEVTVRVVGEIDTFTAPVLGRSLTHAVEHGARHLVIDLRGTTFLGSAGAGVLTTVRKLVSLRGATMTLRPTPKIHHFLEITGLLDLFETDWK